MKGGAVREDRSPLKDAMDLRKAVQLLLLACAAGAVEEDMIVYLRRV